MLLYEWAKRWTLPNAAILELKTLMGIQEDKAEPQEQLSESAVMNIIRLEATRKGARLWRNNVGALYTVDRNFIRYGLANESAGMNRQIKSADLIGIRPITITEKHIGYTIGQFISREIKHSDWSYTGTDREQAQLRWADLILTMGGDACFATGEGTL